MEVDVSGIAATDTNGITKSTWGKRDEELGKSHCSSIVDRK